MIATDRNPIQSALEGFREFFLLEKAEQRLAAIEPPRRDVVRSYFDAANRRLNVAQDLRSPAQTPPALALYREGTQFLALGYLMSRGHLNIDPGSLSVEARWEAFDRALHADGVPALPDYERVKSLLVSSDPLDLDRLSDRETSLRIEQLEATSRWLLELVDARSPAELKWTRILRLGFAVLTAVALVIFAIVRLTTPKNIAEGKPTSSSSVNLGTTAAGIVDGLKTGKFGYHSDLDETPWVAIDLGRPYAIKKVDVFGRGDGVYDQSVPLALEASDDGTNYRQIALRAEAFSEYDPWIVQPAALVTRFIRLRTMRRSVLVLSEVEVYGSPK